MSAYFTLTSSFLVICVCNALPSQHPKLLVISFDGIRADYLNEVRTPNLHKLAVTGATAPSLQPRFLSKTFPNHLSIATGLYEESHGIVGNEFFDPDLNETFDMSYRDAKWWDVGSIPVWTLNDEAGNGRVSGGIMWPGTDGIFHNRTASYFVSYNKSVSWETRVDTTINWFINGDTEGPENLGPANCVFLYIEGADHEGHKYGPYSPQVTEKVRVVDNLVGYLVERLKSHGLDDVNLIITSDHGMSEVPDDNVIILEHFVDPTKYRSFGSSPVLNILPNPGEENYIYEALLNASKGLNFTVYKKDDVPAEYFYRHNKRIMPIVIVADDNWDIVPKESNHHITKNGSGVHGDHGYNNSLPSMQIPFVAHGPAFRPNSVNVPFANIDLFPLMCHILGLTAPPSNGSLENVRSILRHPPGYDINDILLQVTVIILVACLASGILVAIFTICGKGRAKRHTVILRDTQTLTNNTNGAIENRPLLS